MTTQSELIALGEANRERVPAINTVMLVIFCAQIDARSALAALGEQARIRQEGVDFREGYGVMLDNSDVVASAAKAASCMSLIASNLTTLSCLLTQAGVEHSY